MNVQIGWKAGPEQFPPDVLLEAAQAAEAAGFASIDVSDHFQPWSEEGQACFSWAWLGAVAARTSRIRLGTGVTCPILRYHPAIIAQAAATISALAPGRAYLAVGTGEALNEYSATGEWPDYDERQDRLDEAVALIRALWEGNPVDYDGVYYQVRQAKLYTPPKGQIPLYISSMVPGSATFAGKNGDGLWTVGGQEPDLYKQIFAKFDEGARSVERQPEEMPRAIELNVEYSDDLDGAIQNNLKYWAGSYVPALFDQKIYTPAMSAQNGAVVGADTLRKKACISSNAEDHIQFIQRHIDLGFTEIYLHSAAQDQVGFLQRFSQDVLPHLHLQGAVAA